MNELNDVKFRNVIPAYASLDESALYVIERSESDFAEMMKQIGLKELGVLESTGTQIVYEGANMKELVGKIVKWLQDRWADIHGLFNKALNFFKGKAEEFKTKMRNKKVDGLKKRAEKLVDKDFGKTYEYTDFDAIVEGTGALWTAVDKFSKGINDLQWKYDSVKNDTTAGDANDMKDQMETMKEELLKAFGLETSATEANVKDAVRDQIRGKEVTINKAYIVNNIEKAFDDSSNYNKTAGKVKKQFAKVKKTFDEDIKSVKKERKSVNSSYLNMYLPYLKFGKNTVAAISGATVQTIKEKMTTDMRLVLKVAVSKTEKEVKTESAMLESTTYQTELASLFNF